MSTINFQATLSDSHEIASLGSAVLITLPKSASEQLPSRGMTMVEGTINNVPFKAALEPDGKGSHWFKVNEELLGDIKGEVGDVVTLAIQSTKEWREPKVPADLQEVLKADPEAQALWMDITPMARWDWIRWVGAVKQEETRKRRVESVGSRLKVGKRRPCCFDRTQCTLTEA